MAPCRPCLLKILPVTSYPFRLTSRSFRKYASLLKLNLRNLLKMPCFAWELQHIWLCSAKNFKLSHINKINVRLYNTGATIALKKLKAAFIKKLVTVHGTVVKVSTVKPLVLQLKFKCMKCTEEIKRLFCDGKFSPPMSCDTPGCKSRTFTPDRSSAELIDVQKIRIQELASAEGHGEGRVPRTVECELTEDLVDCCIPGEIVTVTGIVKVLNNYMDVGGGTGKSKGRNQGLYYLYLEAISVRNLKSNAVSDEEIRASGISNFQTCSDRDLEFVVKYKEQHGPDVFRQMLQSFSPSIYGHELVKAGITLALFGGVQKNSADQNKVPVRGDIHVVVVGDPGLGKSQLLQAAAAISPRGIYVCGNTTTKAGLTVAVVKDSLTNDYAFEAGAIVLADRGVCCIDEFDKMSAEHQALLEAMEQQCVSVAKAGLVASLSARTSVLAAANPVGGHYDRAKTVNENLKMSAALLSHFDLVFILLDKPDEMLDKRVSDHIIALHSNDRDHSASNKRIKTVSPCNVDLGFGVGGNSFASRLRLHPEKDKIFAPLAGQLLRKYISFAREHVHPRMSKAAGDILQEFYLRLRKGSTSADGTPITARQLESLARLAEARARVDLRDEVTAEDAKDAVEIMRESLYDKYVDENGCGDFTRSGGMSQPKEAKRFMNELNKQSELQQKSYFSRTEIYSLADKISLRVPDVDALVENLDIEGFLLQKGSGMYQLAASSYSQYQPTRSR
ncbi:probable DNA helicase MCM8 isoform X6 [Panicum virgatum]|uniref:probable DNA helicase MCM8 isoform X6 n=1 Tax=Panicum virgatum TaxID=38727 RepID=UPI0019D68BA5|nr:probable DNA helicase MCM8 isoform X6 [Panicum virgatum]